MPRKKKEQEVEESAIAETAEVEAVDEIVVEASAEKASAAEDATASVQAEEAAPAEEVAVKAQAEQAAPVEEDPRVEVQAVEKVAEAVPSKKEKPKAAKRAAPKAAKKAALTAPAEAKKVSKRAEKVGIVSSDKMMKTVVVRVDRLVKHPIYRKYVKRRKKFMAHDEIGAKIGDKVRIVETRPLSARKRWRVVEIIQRAER